jgi:hypothetical protein
MKIIFLDIDGVVCLSREWGSRMRKIKRWELEGGEGQPPVTIRLDDFNKMAVDVLNDIILTSGADIVISSDWRLHATLDEMVDLFHRYGVIKGPIDFTPELQTTTKHSDIRVDEINLWLSKHPEITKWVAIDDMDLGKKIGSISGNSNDGLTNFVKTREREGLKQCNISSKILKFLK